MESSSQKKDNIFDKVSSTKMLFIYSNGTHMVKYIHFYKNPSKSIICVRYLLKVISDKSTFIVNTFVIPSRIPPCNDLLRNLLTLA